MKVQAYNTQNGSKFTPGEWQIEKSGYSSSHLIIAKDRGWGHCKTVGWGNGNQADAQLMAASKDMYEALKEAMDYLCDKQDVDSLYRKIKAALRKATGGER